METITAFVVPIITVVCTILTFVIGRSTAERQKGKEEGALKSDINYIKEKIDDILSRQSENTKTLDSHSERIAKAEEGLRQAYYRIKNIETNNNMKSP